MNPMTAGLTNPMTAGGWIGAAVLCLLAVAVVAVARRRKRAGQTVRRMTPRQKTELLNELAGPLGFCYLEKEGIFTSRLDAWQRKYGYETLFDRTAAAANMVIDAWPVYFDYEGRTWMIEFWKGQYGINTGGEVGIYHAKGLVAPHLYRTAHFDAARDYELPLIRCRLERKGEKLYELAEYHWWLTGFCMGRFSRPQDLSMTAIITFDGMAMAEAFYEGLKRSGWAKNRYRIRRNEVAVQVNDSRTPAKLQRIHRSVVQCGNRLFCRCYRILSYPFTGTADRLLFFYYQLPSCFRKMLRLGSRKTAKWR